MFSYWLNKCLDHTINIFKILWGITMWRLNCSIMSQAVDLFLQDPRNLTHVMSPSIDICHTSLSWAISSNDWLVGYDAYLPHCPPSQSLSLEMLAKVVHLQNTITFLAVSLGKKFLLRILHTGVTMSTQLARNCMQIDKKIYFESVSRGRISKQP